MKPKEGEIYKGTWREGGNRFRSYEYEKLSPADLAAAGLAGWAVVEELKAELRRDIAKWEKDETAHHQFDFSTAQGWKSALERIERLESAHSAALDKYKETLVRAKAWEITIRDYGIVDRLPGFPVIVKEEFILKQARAEVEKGEKKT